jgi:hypothetical protein
MATYTKSSPYFNTQITESGELGFLKIRPVPAEDDDVLYTIESQFQHRPDLLSYVLYGSRNLWWVFAQRNLDVIQDPVYDIEPGTKIYLPKSSSLKSVLGL